MTTVLPALSSVVVIIREVFSTAPTPSKSMIPTRTTFWRTFAATFAASPVRFQLAEKPVAGIIWKAQRLFRLDALKETAAAGEASQQTGNASSTIAPRTAALRDSTFIVLFLLKRIEMAFSLAAS